MGTLVSKKVDYESHLLGSSFGESHSSQTTSRATPRHPPEIPATWEAECGRSTSSRPLWKCLRIQLSSGKGPSSVAGICWLLGHTGHTTARPTGYGGRSCAQEWPRCPGTHTTGDPTTTAKSNTEHGACEGHRHRSATRRHRAAFASLFREEHRPYLAF